MKKKLDIWKWFTPLVLLLATACGHDDLVVPDEYPEEKPSPYIEVRIAVPAANPLTRSNPMGGEEGNGRERGIENEDKIHDINVFFYIEEVDGKGMDSKDETVIIKHIYYNLDNASDSYNSALQSIYEDTHQDDSYSPYYATNYLTLRFECSDEDIARVESTGINFVAIANVGPMQTVSFPNLGKLRNINLDNFGSNTWSSTFDTFSRNASKMDYFLMTTAYNEESNYDGIKTGTNKIGNDYIGSTTLQRMYSRLDLWYNSVKNSPDGNEIKKGEEIRELKYQVVDEDDKDLKINNSVYLTNILPVNVMQKPSYLFKMVTNSIDNFDSDGLKNVLTANNYLWGGKECPTDGPYSSNASTNDFPENYVIERHTLEKSSNGGGDYETWYGNSSLSKVMGKDPDNLESGYKDGDNEHSIRNNNIGKFSEYYHETKAKGEYDANYNCNHISIIGYANENTHPMDCFHSHYLTGMALRAIYVPETIYSGYDSNTKLPISMTLEQKAEFVIKETVEGKEKNKKIYRYSPSKDRKVLEEDALYFIDRSALDAYEKDHIDDQAIVTEFEVGREPVNNSLGFVCYYNLWLRHYNNESNDPQTTYPMEYATVRNNIYRVAVSFSGPGDPEPTMREPDTMKARIFVRKWNYREEATIIF